jgi:ABC-type polysaccharide/polyol phosphate export permease
LTPPFELFDPLAVSLLQFNRLQRQPGQDDEGFLSSIPIYEHLKEISEIVRYKELLKNLILRDIKVRYKRSVLGFLWVMLNPLLMMLILTMVFSNLFGISAKHYTAYLLSGIVLWNFFAQSTMQSTASFVGNANLIRKTYLPKTIFPLSAVMSASVNLVFSLVPLFLVLLITGTPGSSYFFLLPVVLVMVLVFSFGVALILATSTVFFHDTIPIYEVLLLGWMYLTPVFYPESILPPEILSIVRLNPFYHFLNIFRDALYTGNPLRYESLIYGFVFSSSIFIAGWLFYGRFKDRIIYQL